MKTYRYTDSVLFSLSLSLILFFFLFYSLHEARLPFTWGNEATLSKTCTSTRLPPTSQFLLKRTIQLSCGRGRLHSLRTTFDLTVSFVWYLLFTRWVITIIQLHRFRVCWLLLYSLLIDLEILQWYSSVWMRGLLGRLSAFHQTTSPSKLAIWS